MCVQLWRACFNRVFFCVSKGKDKKANPEQPTKQTNLNPRNLNDTIAQMNISPSGETANASNLIKAQLNEYDLNEAILVN